MFNLFQKVQDRLPELIFGLFEGFHMKSSGPHELGSVEKVRCLWRRASDNNRELSGSELLGLLRFNP